jgi:hypothetical protein
MNLDYNTRLAAIQRNEKLAQIMQQQAFQPVEINSYQGIQAPISPLSGLAKVLQAYMGARGTGDEERIKLNQEARAEAQQMLSGLQDRPASPGRAAVMGMPEIQAQPATSFTPMGSDFEDNPNLQTAPSGNVEMPAVAYQPAVAPQAAIPPQAAVSLDPDQKRAKLVEIMMGQNPYASPVAKLEYERLGKESQGPLAEYKFARDFQGYKGTLQEFKQSMRPLPSITNVSMPTSMAPMFVRNRITGKNEYVQPDNRGNFNMANYEPVPTQTPLAQELADAGITPDNPKFQELAQAFINKKLTQVIAPNATVVAPTGETSQATPAPLPGQVNAIVDGKPVAMPIAQAEALNASFKGAETGAVEKARAGFEFVTVPDPKNPAQKILVPKAQVAVQAASGTPVVAEVDKKEAQGQTMIELARKAQSILPSATSGAISTLATMATDAAGIPTNKSASDGQLRIISAQLVSNVPRMEGPQSDADVKLYKQAAADVGNTNIPYQTRIRSLNTIIELNSKYAKGGAQPPAGAVRRIQ